MPTVNLPLPNELNGELNINSLYRSYLDLFDQSLKLRKELSFLMGNLDSDNIESLKVDRLVAGTAKISTALIDDLIVGGNVQIGSAQNAAGVTTIIGNTVTTGYVNALSIIAGSVAAENITGTTITGKTINGGTINGALIKVNDGYFTGIEFNNLGTNIGSIYTGSGILHLVGNVGVDANGVRLDTLKSTIESWVLSQGYSTGGGGIDTAFQDAAGWTYWVTNGLITAETPP